MARRRIRSLPRGRGRRRRADRSAERWLLLLGIVAAITIAAGSITRLPWERERPRVAARRPLTMAQARASNAAVPIESRNRVTAMPYFFRGGPASREQAAECLATAAIYEAGDDRRAQKAVIQVVLNRVRLAGFPKTVCGVVYQGAQRPTGCQFSFTCDGSLARRPEHVGWRIARSEAKRALNGYVFPGVGRATDYHADWVVPYWRDSLAKVARVNTHLFYVRHRRATSSEPE